MPRPRRLPRILLNAATGMSLVLCQVGVIAWWGGLIGGRFVIVLTLLAVSLVMTRLSSHLLRPAADVRAIPCPVCGYDLRATPARCPECGSAPSEEGA
jgi:hypothetical protein